MIETRHWRVLFRRTRCYSNYCQHDQQQFMYVSIYHSSYYESMEQKVSSPTLITKDYASLLSSLAYNQENLILQFVGQVHLTQLQ